MKRAVFFLILIALLWMASSALAMSSSHYRLDWFTPMTGSGGGPVSSAHYTASFTVGQSVTGASASQHYGSGMGYWYGWLSNKLHIFLPVLAKS